MQPVCPHRSFRAPCMCAMRHAGKGGLAEVGITRRVHFIYERATRKFKADLSLWLAWIEFCKRAKSTKQLSKVGRPPARACFKACSFKAWIQAEAHS